MRETRSQVHRAQTRTLEDKEKGCCKQRMRQEEALSRHARLKRQWRARLRYDRRCINIRQRGERKVMS